MCAVDITVVRQLKPLEDLCTQNDESMQLTVVHFTFCSAQMTAPCRYGFFHLTLCVMILS
jgi:hypothetical protein